MGDGPRQDNTRSASDPARLAGQRSHAAGRAMAAMGLLLALFAIAARLLRGPAMDSLLIVSSIVTAALLCRRLSLRAPADQVPELPQVDPETRRQAELEREWADELSRQPDALLDSVADGILGADPDGRLSFANPSAARLLGVRFSRMNGKPVHELLHGAADGIRRCAADCPLSNAAGMRSATAGEATFYRSDGTAFPAEYVITPLLHSENDFDQEHDQEHPFDRESHVETETRIDDGRYIGFVIHFRDISQRVALDRMKDEFISTVSHELRTPLTSIRGALGLLSSGMHGPMDEKASKLLRIALNNSDRLVRLVNDILDLERIQSGRVPPAFRPVHLGEIVRQAIDGMEPIADAAGVRLMYEVVQAEVAADPDRLLQVLTNLLSNAVKFSSPDSIVSVALEPAADGVTVSVTDQGRGIPPGKLDAIFGRFQQVDADDSRQKGGSGLGLAICRTIVQQHSGRIWAERNPECGSTFRVLLPWQPAPLEERAMGDRAMGDQATDTASPIGMLPYEVEE